MGLNLGGPSPKRGPIRNPPRGRQRLIQQAIIDINDTVAVRTDWFEPLSEPAFNLVKEKIVGY